MPIPVFRQNTSYLCKNENKKNDADLQNNYKPKNLTLTLKIR